MVNVFETPRQRAVHGCTVGNCALTVNEHANKICVPDCVCVWVFVCVLGLSVDVIGCVCVSMCGRQCLETQSEHCLSGIREDDRVGTTERWKYRKTSLSFPRNFAYAMCLKYLYSKLLELNWMHLYLLDICTESTKEGQHSWYFHLLMCFTFYNWWLCYNILLQNERVNHLSFLITEAAPMHALTAFNKLNLHNCLYVI